MKGRPSGRGHAGRESGGMAGCCNWAVTSASLGEAAATPRVGAKYGAVHLDGNLAAEHERPRPGRRRPCRQRRSRRTTGTGRRSWGGWRGSSISRLGRSRPRAAPPWPATPAGSKAALQPACRRRRQAGGERVGRMPEGTSTVRWGSCGSFMVGSPPAKGTFQDRQEPFSRRKNWKKIKKATEQAGSSLLHLGRTARLCGWEEGRHPGKAVRNSWRARG